MDEKELWNMYIHQKEKDSELREDLIRFYKSRLEKLIEDKRMFEKR